MSLFVPSAGGKRPLYDKNAIAFSQPGADRWSFHGFEAIRVTLSAMLDGISTVYPGARADCIFPHAPCACGSQSRANALVAEAPSVPT